MRKTGQEDRRTGSPSTPPPVEERQTNTDRTSRSTKCQNHQSRYCCYAACHYLHQKLIKGSCQPGPGPLPLSPRVCKMQYNFLQLSEKIFIPFVIDQVDTFPNEL